VNIWKAVDLQFNALSHRLRRVPVMVLMPHSRCNCRCIMCDIWKANRTGTSITEEQLKGFLDDFRHLGVEWVLLSGGEPLMHPNLWSLCSALKNLPARITLLSTGLLLARNSNEIVRHCDDVIVSLDGSREVHDRIRRIPNAFDELADGVKALRSTHPRYPVSGRCVLQRANFEDLPNIVEAARAIGLDHISFLAADLSSSAFSRAEGWADRIGEVCLSEADTETFASIVEDTLRRNAEAFASGFVVETPARMRKLVAYYRAANGKGAFPSISCNAPWVSAVIESDGTVRPCFFHRSLGNVHNQGFEAIINSAEAIAFRRGLDVHRDPICRRCVCTLTMRA
jgi:MoaA/NifB/PqqE/SkfB family radical SAM enzyme